MKFNLNQKINHHTFGEGSITEIIERTWEKDQTAEPLIWVTFDAPVINALGKTTTKILFSGSSLLRNIEN